MAKPISVTIVGPGSLGTTLAHALRLAGVHVGGIVHRDAKSANRARPLGRTTGASVSPFDDAEFRDELIWLCVGDSVIARVAANLAKRRPWKGTVFFHSSGALTSDELAPLRHKGAAIASVHPMMTFVRSSSPSMKGVTFALEGDASAIRVARRLVRAMGGESIVIAKKDKALYHALGAFVSPLIVAQMAATDRIGRELGLSPSRVRKTVAPILRQTINNYLEHGAAASFSGPIVRGDAETVRKNLIALKRVAGAAEIYRALARVALEELPAKNSKTIKKVIAQ